MKMSYFNGKKRTLTVTVTANPDVHVALFVGYVLINAQ